MQALQVELVQIADEWQLPWSGQAGEGAQRRLRGGLYFDLVHGEFLEAARSVDNTRMHLDIPDRRFAGYIFDCDGTLADTMPIHHRAWQRLMAELGGDFPEELFYSWGGRPTRQILELLRDDRGLAVDDIEAAARRKETYYLEMIHEAKPIEPVVQVARRLYGSAPLAVASGGFHKYVELTLEAIGARGLFSVVICAEDTARGKPFPDPFLEAARRLCVAPQECLVFEDSPLGIRAAEAAGMQSVFVPRTGS
jgi:HAD superfamily hydrolase (TIGR01509 family)